MSASRVLLSLLVSTLLVLALYLLIGKEVSLEYDSSALARATAEHPSIAVASTTEGSGATERVATHLPTPSPLYGAYMTSCIASGKSLRAPLVSLVEESDLNALVIDIKDYTGMISFDAKDDRFTLNTKGCSIPDIEGFIDELHQKGIYVIGRVTVMQDSTYTNSHPSSAVKRRSTGETWKDKKGLSFIDPGATEYWQYMVDLGVTSHRVGFDEINYDYIRYPSDGDMSDAIYARTGSTSKSEMMRRFYEFLGKELRKKGIPSSADLFGMTTTNTDDLGIGQVLEHALLNFDYVAPMVYPSHFPPSFNGWKDPNLVPYELIEYTMSRAVSRANDLEKKESGWEPVVTVVSSTTGSISTTTNAKFVPTGRYAKRLRPWLQDFDCCAPNSHEYTEADVRAQARGAYASGVDSWMVWDPRNDYTDEAYSGIARPRAATDSLRQ